MEEFIAAVGLTFLVKIGLVIAILAAVAFLAWQIAEL